MTEAFTELTHSLHTALETYSNVHRGSGHNSLVSTHLYEQAREIVLEHLGLDQDRYTVVFCTPRRAEQLKDRLKAGSYHILSSQEIGLPLGLRAVAVARNALPAGAPFQAGGGTARQKTSTISPFPRPLLPSMRSLLRGGGDVYASSSAC